LQGLWLVHVFRLPVQNAKRQVREPQGRPRRRLGRDWRNPRFAVCDALDTPEAHVFGDVVFRSEPVASK